MMDDEMDYKRFYRGDSVIFNKKRLREFIKTIGNDIYEQDKVKHYLINNSKRFSDEIFDDGVKVYLSKDAFRLLRDYYTLSIEEVISESWYQSAVDGEIYLDEIHLLKGIHRIGRNMFKMEGIKL